MAPCATVEVSPHVEAVREGTRVLCLGNELLADDAFGLEVAKRLAQLLPPEIEIITSAESGFRLIEGVTGCEDLTLVDSIRTGAPPGTIHIVDSEQLDTAVAISPHRMGVTEVLKAAGRLGLRVPNRIRIYAVEVADVMTIGGAMDARVHNAVETVTNLIAQAFGKSPCKDSTLAAR